MQSHFSAKSFLYRDLNYGIIELKLKERISSHRKVPSMPSINQRMFPSSDLSCTEITDLIIKDLITPRKGLHGLRLVYVRHNAAQQHVGISVSGVPTFGVGALRLEN